MIDFGLQLGSQERAPEITFRGFGVSWGHLGAKMAPRPSRDKDFLLVMMIARVGCDGRLVGALGGLVVSVCLFAFCCVALLIGTFCCLVWLVCLLGWLS